MPTIGRVCGVGRETPTDRVRRAFAQVECAIMDLEQLRRDAELHVAVQELDWQDGPEGERYIAQLRGVSEAAAALSAVETPDVGVLR